MTAEVEVRELVTVRHTRMFLVIVVTPTIHCTVLVLVVYGSSCCEWLYCCCLFGTRVSVRYLDTAKRKEPLRSEFNLED